MFHSQCRKTQWPLFDALNSDTDNLAANPQMTAFKDLVDLFVAYSYDDVAMIDYEKQYSDFAVGKTAFMQQSNWTINQLNEIDDALDIAFLPISISDDPSWSNDSIPVGVPNYWVVNSKLSTEEIEAAKLFLDYMAMSERGQKFMVEDAKYIPCFYKYRNRQHGSTCKIHLILLGNGQDDSMGMACIPKWNE